MFGSKDKSGFKVIIETEVLNTGLSELVVSTNEATLTLKKKGTHLFNWLV